MNYFKFSLTLTNFNEQSVEIITAFLFQLGFESCEESKNNIYAYASEDNVTDDLINEIEILSINLNFKFTFKEIITENWNKKWESNFKPIQINNDCIIRASFHKQIKLKYEIVIDPKMSFGTGHHETTFLICKELFDINLENKNVLDFGCGTGILSILSSKLNAKSVTAIDYDNKCIDNTFENLKKNNIDNVELIKDDKVPKNKKFDLIISNINRNVILKSFEAFIETEAKEFILSGFLETDFEILLSKIKDLKFHLINKKNKNGWLMLRIKK